MMSAHFLAYATNLSRVSLLELIDQHDLQLRQARMRASLIANPLTGRPYAGSEIADAIETAAREPTAA